MTSYLAATLIACGVLLSLPAQAAVASGVAAVKSDVTGSVVVVRHCRRHSGGWGCHRH